MVKETRVPNENHRQPQVIANFRTCPSRESNLVSGGRQRVFKSKAIDHSAFGAGPVDIFIDALALNGSSNERDRVIRQYLLLKLQ